MLQFELHPNTELQLDIASLQGRQWAPLVRGIPNNFLDAAIAETDFPNHKKNQNQEKSVPEQFNNKQQPNPAATFLKAASAKDTGVSLLAYETLFDTW